MGVKMMIVSKIKANRTWNFGNIRAACIRNNLYTCGTTEEYNNLANFINKHKPTYENIYMVAFDIYNHSEGQTITNIMYIIERECVYTTFELDGRDDI